MKESEMQLSGSDIKHIIRHQLTPDLIARQLSRLRAGKHNLQLAAPARVGEGILCLNQTEMKRLGSHYHHLVQQKGLRICKFVPASGAASRMFHFLRAYHAILDQAGKPEVDLFFREFHRFPFYPLFHKTCSHQSSETNCLEVLRWLLDEQKFAQRPKALLPFHLHQGLSRNPLHEHSAELIALVDLHHLNQAQLHLTVSREHQQEFISAMKQVDIDLDTSIPFTLSTQLSCTDTVALSESGEILRDSAHDIIFRPGGHGALIHNLDQIEADLIFIKNIDNIPHPSVPDRGLPEREAMAGLLLEILSLRNQLLDTIDGQNPLSPELIKEIKTASKKWPGIFPAETIHLFKTNPQALKKHLDRPIRVCGMVPNQGEPGGGPFWVENQQGRRNLQIVEQAQIDHEDPQQAAMLAGSTHFNPVDMVCSRIDAQGRPYHLAQFIDEDSGIVTSKNHEGKTIRVLEHPGLWNGSMADWLTLMVEMDPRSFCPVKTINDLLRSAHQPSS